MKKLVISLAIGLTSLTLMAQQYEGCSAKAHFQSKYLQNRINSGLKSTTDYDVHYYKLDLHLENNTTFIEGMGRIGALASTNLSSVEFELHSNYTIDSIVVQGVKQPYSRTSSVITVNLFATISQGSTFNIDVYYHGNAPSGGTAAIGDGFSTGSSPSWGNSVTWSLSEPYAAYEWFPVKQVLNDKADSSEVWITTDSSNMAGSNGVLENITSITGGKKRYEWKSRYPIAYYLISVSVAQYVDYTIYAKPAGINDSIKIVNFIYNNPATLPNFKSEIDKTADMLEVFSEKYGMYPFYQEKYGHCMAPFSGGMEHQTMTTQGFFFTDLTSHELGHQWFGDHITCGSWADIWINEGFASYSEYVYIEEKEPGRGPSWLDDTESSALFSPTGSIHVDDTTNVGRIFSSSLSYNKGAFLLHMLRYEIDNDFLFFQGLRDYLQQYGGGTALGTDFLSIMKSSTGRPDLDVYFNQYYFGEGYPLYNINWNQDKLGNLDMVVDQVVSAPSATPIIQSHLDLLITRSSLPDTLIRILIDQTSQTYTIEDVNGTITGLIVDPYNWVLNAEGSVVKNPTIDLGIESSAENNAVKLYPNPTAGIFSVEFEKVQTQISLQLSDAKGSVIDSWSYNEKKRIEMSIVHSPGIYFLLVNTNELNELLKLVIE
ncbi:MAG: M1 family aminopeptidase [Vicingaceae bacterium]